MPIKNFFADDPQPKAAGAPKGSQEVPNDDLFSNMQSIDLFEDGADQFSDFAALTDLPEMPELPEMPALQNDLFASETSAQSSAPHNVGEAIFQNLFADDAAASPFAAPEVASQDDMFSAPQGFTGLDLFSEEPAPVPPAAPAPSAPKTTESDVEVPAFMGQQAPVSRPKPQFFDYDTAEPQPLQPSAAGDFSFENAPALDPFTELSMDGLAPFSGDLNGGDAFAEPSAVQSAPISAAPYTPPIPVEQRQYKPLFPAGFTANFMKPEPPVMKTAAEVAAEQEAQKIAEEQARQEQLVREMAAQVAPLQPAPVSPEPVFGDAFSAIPQEPVLPEPAVETPAAPAQPVLETPAAPSGDPFAFSFEDAFEGMAASETAEDAVFLPAQEEPAEEPELPQSQPPLASNLQALLMGDEMPQQAAQPAADVFDMFSTAPTDPWQDAPTREVSLEELRSAQAQAQEPVPQTVAPQIFDAPAAPDGFEAFDFSDDFTQEPADASLFSAHEPKQPAFDSFDAFEGGFDANLDNPFDTPMQEPAQAPSAFSDAFAAIKSGETASESAPNPFASEEWSDNFDDEEEPPVKKRASRSTPPKKQNNLPLIVLLVILIVAIGGVGWYALFGGKSGGAGSSSVAPPSSSSASQDESTSEPEIPVEPEVIVPPIPRDEWYMVLVNDQNRLTESYTITTAKTVDGIEVDARIVEALNQMIADAAAQGINLKTVAGYRSYARQAAAYAAGTSTAAAGSSEHNSGLAVDIQSKTSYNYSADFTNSAEAAWLRANAVNYGFIERYPEGSQSVTGFTPEPWHYRYVGVDQAQKIKDSGLLLEEYLAQDIPTGIPTL